MGPGDDDFDILVIGAGIAGASIAYFTSAQARVALVEREAQPGMQTTGRSAAMFMESYGPPQVRALTRASRGFLRTPLDGGPALITPRGALYIAAAARIPALQSLHDSLRSEGAPAIWHNGDAAQSLVPVLRPEAPAAALLDEAACDIDVDRLLQGFLRGARRQGAELHLDAEVKAIERSAGLWHLMTRTRTLRAPLLVNAAGAWADELGRMAGAAPLGLQPRRRSAHLGGLAQLRR